MLKRTNDKPEPLPTLSPPPELSPVAKQEWTRICDELIAAGVLSSVDRAVLSAYCTAWATWLEATRELQEHGLMATAPSGYQIPSPWLAVINKQAALLLRLADQLGFSPASRRRHFNMDLQRKLLLHDPSPVDEFGMPVVA